MVVQGVKNPMVDLQSLDDKLLDEVMLKTLDHYMNTVSISKVRILPILLFLSSGLRLLNGSFHIQLHQNGKRE